MNIKIKTDDLKEKILKPLNRIVEDGILTVENGKITSIASVDSGGIIVLISKSVDVEVETPVNLNIKGINKLVSVLNCVNDSEVVMKVESNHIKYDSKGFKFKFHLTEDGIITKPKIKREKLENISYNTCATIEAESFYSILKSSSLLSSDNVRLYFYTKAVEERGIYCDITNKTIANSDCVTIKISDDFEGDPITGELICDIEHIRKLAIKKTSNVRMYFDSNIGYTVVDVIENDGSIRYVMPTLSK